MSGTPAETVADEKENLVALGRALFFDTNLSANRTQSCASCHEPGNAFTDTRDNGVAAAVSMGDDEKSLGDRNAPTLTYAHLIPDLQQNDAGEYVGGFFHDGRAVTMADQAAEPFTNPIEMALANTAAVVSRVQENESYAELMQSTFGSAIFADESAAFDAILKSIVAFERTDLFAPFDSKYDRFLRGEYELTDAEEFGRLLFFSKIINCSSCHLSDEREYGQRETFTDNLYHNIGVPKNVAARSKNGLGENHVDSGLLQNPSVNDLQQAGKFRVPSLRNVAVTGPYMHNGVFRELETVILFYNQFTVLNPDSVTNPETGKPWRSPEEEQNRALDLLAEGQPMSDANVAAVSAFLKTLTDKRYEALLE